MISNTYMDRMVRTVRQLIECNYPMDRALQLVQVSFGLTNADMIELTNRLAHD